MSTLKTFRAWFTVAGADSPRSCLIVAGSEQAAREVTERRAKTEGGGKYRFGELVLVTKPLVVGQVVTIVSGVYGGEGKVVRATPDGVDVSLNFDSCVYQFDNEGMGCDGAETFECGPWYLADICPHVLDSDEYHCKLCWYPIGAK